MHTHPSVSRAILGGFIGTLAMSAIIYVVGPMMGVHMDIAAMLGSMLGNSWAAGLMMHFVNGAIIFPTIFVVGLYGVLPGSSVVKGTTWGVALWLVAQVVVMPMMGAGLFSSQMGGAMAAMGSLIGHLLYGSLLGSIVGSTQPRVVHA